MKIPVYVIPLLLLLRTLPGTAQDSSAYILSDYETRDTVSRYIYQLRKSGADTVIRFDLPPTHATSDTALELSHLQYPNTSYIFYRTGNKPFVTHYAWSEKAGHEYRQVTTDDLDKQNPYGMINANYEANTQTKLYQLFLQLEERRNEIFTPSLPKTTLFWDTIQFCLPINYAYQDSIPGLGRLYMPLVIYTIARKDHQLMTQMKLTYQQERCSGLASAISDWLPINNDTLLSWLDNYAAAIKSEDLMPFVRRWEVNGVPHYDYGISTHSPTYHISVITPQENIWKAIDLYCLEASTHERRTHNLNYPYNTSLILYQLYSKLRHYTEAWDSQYVLRKTKE